MKRAMDPLQRLGRALMLPIAVLPVAGLLLRLGQPDLLGIAVLAAAGDAVFSNLGLVFSVGVAVGIARENHGAAGLASLVGFLIATKGAETILTVPPYVTEGLAESAAGAAAVAWKTAQLAKLTMPVGILSGLIAGAAYNRWSTIQLPSYLAFFAGRRFVPIVTGCLGVLVALAFGWGWPWLATGIDAISHVVTSAGGFGLFLYGFLNRLLIVTGLHHILNNLVWFLLGDFHGVTGDLKRFFAGDPNAGDFMSGFFPVMMFGLPGACLAMYRSVSVARRQQVAGLLLSIGLTSFLTGVTEPIEFTFMFLAPLLYLVHAVLTGLSMVLMHGLGVHLGFSFSAGLFDYVLNFGKSTHPWLLLPVGAGYFALYYAVFRWVIGYFDLPTPGREPQPVDIATVDSGASVSRIDQFIAALGGPANLRSVDACTTRLRLGVSDSAQLDGPALAALGAMGVVKPSTTVAQVILGPIADQIAGEIRARLGERSATAELTPPSVPTMLSAALPGAPLLALMGGRDNLESVSATSGRLMVRLRKIPALSDAAWHEAGVRDVGLTANGTLHLLIGDAAMPTAQALQKR